MTLLFLFLLADFLILQPIRCIVGFVARFLWHPVEYVKDKEYETADLVQIKYDAIKNYAWNELLRSNDCGKFLGLYLANTVDDSKLDYFRRLLDKENKTFKRQNYEYDKEVDFSTDMLPGLMLVLLHYPSLWGKEELKPILDHITFNKIPFCFPNGYGEKRFKRGWFFNPGIVWASHNILTVLSWLALCNSVFPDWRYKALYYLIMLLEFPSIILACPVGNIQLPKFGIIGTAWHQIHSKMIVYCVGYELTKNWIFKQAASKIYRYHRVFNPEIVGLFYKYILQHPIDENSEDYKNALNAILACNEKGSMDSSSFETKIYYDIRSLKEYKLLTLMHSCVYRNEEYQWERNPQKQQTMLADYYRKTHRLDVYNAIRLLDK